MLRYIETPPHIPAAWLASSPPTHSTPSTLRGRRDQVYIVRSPLFARAAASRLFISSTAIGSPPEWIDISGRPRQCQGHNRGSTSPAGAKKKIGSPAPSGRSVGVQCHPPLGDPNL